MRLLIAAIFLSSSIGAVFNSFAEPVTAVKKRVLLGGELAPLPEAKPLLLKLAEVIDSKDLRFAISDSRSLQMMRERVRTSIFHLNFRFEITDDSYPYDAPFDAPFPFRATLEAINEAGNFFEIVQRTTGFKTQLPRLIEKFPYFDVLKVLFPRPSKQPKVPAIRKEEIAQSPVDSYVELVNRKIKFGELASFPEFEESVRSILLELQSEEVKGFAVSDPAFSEYVERSVKELKSVSRGNNVELSDRMYPPATAAFPYRQTIQALERAVLVLDIRERLKYPVGLNWHDVEISWFHGNTPKILGLYHFNRYKYQMAGLLAEKEQVLLPVWGGVSTDYILRIRVVPIGLLEVAPVTERVDRHHNTPTDAFHHDSNHNRRMLGYDKAKAKRLGAKTFQDRIHIYREQEVFVKELLEKIALTPGLSEEELETRKQIRVLLFETFHETAMPPDRESILKDLQRLPATPQPFEVQVQTELSNLEDIRTFDGNLKSGADQLSLNLDMPTTIRFFYDRAPGFLANVDNKLRWGFYDSVFQMKRYITRAKFRTPRRLAIAVTRLFELLGHIPPSMQDLTQQMTDRSGQQELWNYFGVRERGIFKVSGLNALNIAVPNEIHDNWRMISEYADRWKPTNAHLRDGTQVNSLQTTQEYFKEKGIPQYLQEFYRLGNDPVTQEVILFEDIRNLPNILLANNHRNENLMSSAKAVSIVDRIWQYLIVFPDLDSVERWLVAACQGVHQAVLDRNANGARYNPTYNQHWLLIPPQNQVNDLDLVRIAFEERMKIGKRSISDDQVLLLREGINRLYRKIRSGQPVRTCNAIASHQRDLNLRQ
jgi:hypothetical protein